MKNTTVKLFQGSLYLIGLIILVLVLIFALSIRPQVSTQEDGIQSLQERLARTGIPIKSLKVTSQSPLEVEVIINSSASDGKLSHEDVLNQFLAVREIELAYLHFGALINSYRLVLETKEGNPIYDSTVFLNPDLPSQKLSQAPPSPVDTSKTKQILESMLDFRGLKLLTLQVPSTYPASDNSKLVTFDLSTGTAAENTDNAQIQEFLMSLRQQIEEINQRSDTGVVLFHVRILDSNNRLLVEYLEDIETWKQVTWIDETFIADWYPQPAPDSSPVPQVTPSPVVYPTLPPQSPYP